MNIYKQKAIKRLFGDSKFNDIDREGQLEININKRGEKIIGYLENIDKSIKQLQSLYKKMDDEHYDGNYINAKKFNKAIENTCNDIKKICPVLDYFLTEQNKDEVEYAKLLS
jgi:septation ring formation regulator EzrA